MQVGKWLWLSWQSGRFQYQRSAVRIQSLAKNYLYQTFVYCQLCIEKTKIKKKRPGMAHFFKKKCRQVGNRRSSVDSFASTIVRSRVRMPSTPHHLRFYAVKFCTIFVIVLRKGRKRAWLVHLNFKYLGRQGSE